MKKVDFEWTNLPDPEDWVSFRIDLYTGYCWGNGWSSEEESKNYKKDLYKYLSFSGDFDLHDGDSHGGCATIGRPGDDLYAYLHPMEWTGSGRLSKVEKLLKRIEYMPSIKKTSQAEYTPAYKLAPYQMDNLLHDNTLGIIAYIDSYSRSMSIFENVGMDFYHDNPLNLVSYGGCFVYSSSDQIIKYVNDMADTYRTLLDAGIIQKGDISKKYDELRKNNLAEETEEREDR